MQLGPETEALRWCLRMGLGSSSSGELPRAVDWDSVCRQALGEGVAPLLVRGLRLAGSTCELPAEALARCSDEYYATAHTNTLIYDRLSKLLAAFPARGITGLPLKGAHLVELVYGNLALRRVGDVDLLIKADDLPQAVEAMAGLGYRIPARARARARRPGAHHHLPGVSGPGLPTVELHWGLVAPGSQLSIDIAGVWQRARPAQFDGANALVMSPEDLLLHVCLHLAWSNLFRRVWRPLCDVTQIIRHHAGELDWGRVAASAEVWRVGKCVGVVVGLARDLLGAPAPDEVERQLGVLEADMQIGREIVARGPDPCEGHRNKHQDVFNAAHPKDEAGPPKANLVLRVLAWSRAARRYGMSPDGLWDSLKWASAAVQRPGELRRVRRGIAWRQRVESWLADAGNRDSHHSR